MKWWGLLFALLSLQVTADEVRVAVASNFLSTLKALQPVYEQQSSHRLVISSGSTGKLYAQIVNGAPYDVLLAADSYHPEQLEQLGHVVPGSRFVYAIGQLVLWSSEANEPISQSSLEQYSGRVALANPRTAPYGAAAQAVMDKLGVTQQVKRIKGESVGQAFQFTATGNVGYGFVAWSQVLNPLNRFNRDYYWKIPESFYSPLAQEVAALKQSQNNPSATVFLEFLKSPDARKIITSNGYR